MAPSTTKIKPYNDPRISYRSAILNDKAYGYIHSPRSPNAPNRGTIILIHGFPDLSFGWRYQIPLLTSLGLEVLAIDCQGYGRSESPPTSSLKSYTCKTFADDLAELCLQLNLHSVILIGHDWGGHLVYRVALYHPKLIKAFASICTPYQPPDNNPYIPLQQIVSTTLPNFRYQLQFASGIVETQIRSNHEINQFLNSLYGARTTDDGKVGFMVEEGVLFDLTRKIGKNKLLDEEEMKYYVREYVRNGINGPLNWYRTRELNYLDELEYFFQGRVAGTATTTTTNNKGTTNTSHNNYNKDGGENGGGKNGGSNERKVPYKEIKITQPEVLFIQATKDAALKPFMARNMGRRIEKLTWKTVEAGHWALWERSAEVNGLLEGWLRGKVFGDDGSDGGDGKGGKDGKDGNWGLWSKL